MIAQIKFTVRGDTYDELVKFAESELAHFMPDEPKDAWRIVMEVHDTQPDRSTSHHDDTAWMAHVTVRRKRRPIDPDYDEF